MRSVNDANPEVKSSVKVITIAVDSNNIVVTTIDSSNIYHQTYDKFLYSW